MTHTRSLVGTEIVFYLDPVEKPFTVAVMHDQDYVDIVLEAARQLYQEHDRKVDAIKFVRNNLVPRDEEGTMLTMGADFDQTIDIERPILSLFDAKCIVEDL